MSFRSEEDVVAPDNPGLGVEYFSQDKLIMMSVIVLRPTATEWAGSRTRPCHPRQQYRFLIMS